MNVGSTIMAGTMLRATIALSKGRGLFRIFQTSIRSHAMLGAWIFSAWLGLAGCVYIPPIAQEDAGIDPASFKIGTTSRSDVLSVLGEPLVDDGRFILDELYTSAGGFLLAAGGSGGYIPIGEKWTRLLLEFNESDILERLDVETAEVCRGQELSPRRRDLCQVASGSFSDVARVEAALQELEPLGKLLPFNDVSWFSGPPSFHAAAFSPKGNLLAAIDSSDQIFLIDFVRRTIERISPEGFETDGYVFSMTFSPDGNSLAVLSRTIRIIDLKTRKQTFLYDGHGNASWWETKGARAMAYAPSGKVIASGGYGGDVKIWEASTGREIASWVAHETWVDAITFSTDGAILATSNGLGLGSGDRFVRLWDRKTGAELGAINRGGKPTFSDDGNRLAIASLNHAEWWSLDRDSSGTSQGQTLTLDGPMDMIILPYSNPPLKGIILYSSIFTPSLIFTPGGRRLLNRAGSIVIWDWTERRRTQLPIPIGGTFLAFSPDGRTMATAGRDGVRLWKIPVMKNN